MPTRAQARRAIEWEEFIAKPRVKRGKNFPRCVTCGATSDHTFAVGEPAYPCQHDEPFRIDADTLARARAEFGTPTRRRAKANRF
jgi:hypothetical protein